ncbi:MAG: efflux RND transporter periplasmic adaptor subunit [Candidatus Heteroscillospira sp.]|jgi:HlyD family secretion protein
MNFLKKRDGVSTSENTQTGTKKKLSKKTIAIAVAVAAVIIAARAFWPGEAKQPDTQEAYTTQKVERGDISSTLTGSGTLEAANSYSVTALVEGEILSADFEEGDVVEKDSVLYELDSSDAASSIETSEMSLSSSQRSYQDAVEDLEDLNVKSPGSGTLVELNVDVGDEVSAGQTIGLVRDSSTMELTVDFPADDAAGFYIGQSGTVTLDGSFETLSATVANVSGSEKVATGNSIVRSVTLSVSNPGGISNTQAATAEVGGVGSSSNSTFDYRAERNVTANVSGKVTAISVNEGDVLAENQTILILSSDNLSDTVQSQAESVRRAEISLENAQKTLDNYTITSPIAGTIIDKNYKAGESAESGKVLCTIYDLSYLTLTLSVDELDISNVSVGQKVKITADAVEDKTYEGTVTKVSVAGTTSGGYTSYPVTIRLDETEGLMPGMNVDATIEMSSAENVLTMPISALERGDKVLVTADSPSAANALEDEAPEGYVYVKVETGVSSDELIEIVSGLTEEDTVAYNASAQSDSTQMMQPGMQMGGSPGGGPGGGAPAGGPGGY